MQTPIIGIYPFFKKLIYLCLYEETSLITDENINEAYESALNDVAEAVNHLKTINVIHLQRGVESQMGDLLHAYYTIRSGMKGLGDDEDVLPRKLMLKTYEVIVILIMRVSESVKVEYSEEFISSWRDRTSYFPFADSMAAGATKPKMNITASSKTKAFDRPKGIDESQSGPTERIINKEELKQYFKAPFKSAGNNGTNYFEEYFIPDIMKLNNAKDIARMATVIYGSDKMIQTQKPHTFKEWYMCFCKMVGGEYNPSYKMSRFNNEIESLKRKYHYL